MKTQTLGTGHLQFNPAVQSTIYMEPAPMVELNNTEAMLSSAEEEEEMTILAALSRQVQPPPFALLFPRHHTPR